MPSSLLFDSYGSDDSVQRGKVAWRQSIEFHKKTKVKNGFYNKKKTTVAEEMYEKYLSLSENRFVALFLQKILPKV